MRQLTFTLHAPLPLLDCREATTAPAKATGFNTGRLYQADGQRISFAVVDGDVLFNDHSRGISGKITSPLSSVDARRILAAYDRNAYSYDSRADKVKADSWPPLR